jgi:protein disulfide-isomerase-like protein
MLTFLAFLLHCALSAYVEITGNNVNKHIGGPKPALVKFYSPGCGHCEAMAEDFDEAASVFTDVTFGGVDCIQEDALCSNFDIGGYPTIYFFKANDEKPIDYEGGRTADDFISFVESKTGIISKRGPSLLKIVHPYNYEALVNDTSRCSVILFCDAYTPDCKEFNMIFKELGTIFQADSNVTIGRVLCD